MTVREPRRRWRPGRQTLSRIEPEIREGTPPDTQADDGAAGYDPVYDWFDLRRGVRTDEEPAEHG